MGRIEKLKSIVLVVLVLISLVLTTQIWFGTTLWDRTSVEEVAAVKPYDQTLLFLPQKIVVNTGEESSRYMILIEKNSKTAYEDILGAVRQALRTGFDSGLTGETKVLDLEKLETLRKRRTVEIFLQDLIPKAILAGMLDIKESTLVRIKAADEILISIDSGTVWFVDSQEGEILEIKFREMKNELEAILAEVKQKNLCIYMNVTNPALYGANMIMPVSATGDIPQIAVTREYQTSRETEHVVDMFVNVEESKRILVQGGAIMYSDDSDGQTQRLRIEPSGRIEYTRYDIGAVRNAESVEVAFQTAVQFIHSHLGFPEQSYLKKVTPIYNGQKITGYQFGFGYCMEGTPVVLRGDAAACAIEVEVVGSDVRRYQRDVRLEVSVERQQQIKAAGEILDGILSSKTFAEGETIEDMRLCMYEADVFANTEAGEEAQVITKMVPVWTVVKRTAKGNIRNMIVSGQTGVILDY